MITSGAACDNCRRGVICGKKFRAKDESMHVGQARKVLHGRRKCGAGAQLEQDAQYGDGGDAADAKYVQVRLDLWCGRGQGRSGGINFLRRTPWGFESGKSSGLVNMCAHL